LGEDPIGFSSGDFNFYRYVGNSPAYWIDPSGLGKLGALKKALKEVYKRLDLDGPLQPKGKGKFGSPKRGCDKKGYRYDPGHPGKPKGDDEYGDHINYWDYSKGKRKNGGGKKGAVPLDHWIIIPGASLGYDVCGDDYGEICNIFNPLSDVQDIVGLF
jgi:uncharacterized protein RhaS with RHS repeats